MSWAWERRIQHLDRRVRPTGMRGMRLQLLAERVRRRRGLPSRSLSSDLIMYDFARRAGLPTAFTAKQAAWLRLREQLLSRKLEQQRRIFAQRRRSITTTGIWRARRRAAWLQKAEASILVDGALDLFDVVALREPLPDYNLEQGDAGTVVEILDADTVLVEFAGDGEVAKAVVPVAVLQLEARYTKRH